ncbi:MAG: hypothetical protein GDA48_02075 [Hormoscilla sp. GM102CHS1]|nr:hypothetical protein [Hormoscilla sp. GM102CHS1]
MSLKTVRTIVPLFLSAIAYGGQLASTKNRFCMTIMLELHQNGAAKKKLQSRL